MCCFVGSKLHFCSWRYCILCLFLSIDKLSKNKKQKQTNQKNNKYNTQKTPKKTAKKRNKNVVKKQQQKHISKMEKFQGKKTIAWSRSCMFISNSSSPIWWILILFEVMNKNCCTYLDLWEFVLTTARLRFLLYSRIKIRR